MNITRSPEFEEAIVKRLAEDFGGRSEGIHSSDLIYCLNKQALRKLQPLPQTRHETLLFSLGWSTQHELTRTFKPEKEYEVDGIIVTPDVDNEHFLSSGLPWELKATYQSSTKPIEEAVNWLRQLMSQCHVLGVRVAFISRLEIMGNWKWVYGFKAKPKTIQKYIDEFGENWADHPTLTAWQVEFSQDELDYHWRWMLDRKCLYEQVMRTKELLPKVLALASLQAYECDYCPYKTMCDEAQEGWKKE